MSIEQLIERIEAADGPDRGIDVAIFKMLHPEYASDDWRLYGSGLRHVYDSSDARCTPPPEACPPYYTASIDAAMKLAPEGSHCGMGYDSPPTGETVGKAWAWVRCKVNGVWEETDIDWRGHRPPSMAPALCAAALKARLA